jgi:hypothetical protein
MAMCAGLVYRTACNTIPLWPDVRALLDAAEEEHFPIVSVSVARDATIGGTALPWLTTSLRKISVLLHRTQRFLQFLCVRAMRSESPNNCRNSAKCVDQFLDIDLDSELARRLNLWTPAGLVQQHHLDCIPVLCQVLSKLNPQIRVMFVKSFLNAWCTSHRAHEIIRKNCIVGCPLLPDALSHYIECEVMWTQIYIALQVPHEENLCVCLGSQCSHFHSPCGRP